MQAASGPRAWPRRSPSAEAQAEEHGELEGRDEVIDWVSLARYGVMVTVVGSTQCLCSFV